MPNYRNYNPNTKYGRRKLREQAHSDYVNGTPEYRQQRDEFGCIAWVVVMVIGLIIFFIMAITKSPEAAVKWLK